MVYLTTMPKGSTKAAIVTGAAKGIGAATAAALLNEGFDVVRADIDIPEDSEELYVKTDVTIAADVERAAAECVSNFGRIDVLVNSAGIQRYGDAVDTPESVWDEVLAVNLKSMFLMAKYCVPHMQEGSAIVNVASVQGLSAQKGVAAYAASKGGVIALTRAMAVDFAPRVRVNCVLPGSVDTPMLRASAAKFAEVPEEAIESWGNMHPIGRVAQPQEIASAIVFLAGPGASFITGAALLVDGGLLSVIGGT